MYAFHSIRRPASIEALTTLFLPFQDHAYEPSQKYKEGKYILERNLLIDVQ